MNMNNRGQGGTASFGPLGFVVKGIAAGIGLASESIHHHKETKAAKKAEAAQCVQLSSQSPPAYEEQKYECGEYTGDKKTVVETQEEPLAEEGDEEQWDLDDAQDGLIFKAPHPTKRPFERDRKQITQHFIDDYPVPQGFQPGGVAHQVILPQRRPKDRTRGYIRAYAPDLMNCGIDLAMFLVFLETFNLASQSSPWLNAINLAGLALMPLPTGIS